MMKIQSFENLMSDFQNQSSERLGQFFINRYLGSQPWPELYYTEDEGKAERLIKQWLVENCYEQELPTKRSET